MTMKITFTKPLVNKSILLKSLFLKSPPNKLICKTILNNDEKALVLKTLF